MVSYGKCVDFGGAGGIYGGKLNFITAVLL
jgi:hypothetical protein